jgi:hypothetical protein
MNQIHEINNFNMNNIQNLPVNFYFVYNQYTNSNNRPNIRKYIMVYIDYILYNTRQNNNIYPLNYAEYILNEYDVVNEILFNDIDINIIIRFKNIIDGLDRNQKIDIYNIMNIHDF